MKFAIADALSSKKFLAFLATLIVVIGNKCVGHWGYELDASQVALLVGSAATYMLGQGIADHGKTAADTNAAVAAAIAMPDGAEKTAALALFHGALMPITPSNTTEQKQAQGGFASPGVMLLIVSIGMALHLGCGASARQKTLTSTLVGLDSAEIGIVTFNKDYEDKIIADCRDDSTCTEAIGHARLLAYRASRDQIVTALKAAYAMLGQAFVLDTDASMANVVAAAAVIATQLNALGIK